ncbi:MAG: BON domain-containing protein, partial [Blastocatellia bacterium]
MPKRLAVTTLLILLVAGGYYLYRFGFRKPTWGMITSTTIDDPTVTEKVKTALGLSKHLAGTQVNVKTEGGVVTLTGEVQSEESKDVAGSITRDTMGVKDVKNLLIVNPEANASTEGSRVRDIDIRADLLQAILKSSTLSSKKFDVKVDNQVVTLSGTVDTPADKSGAEQVARSIDGVNAVTNNLAVANPQAPTEPPAGTRPAADPNADLAKRVEFELYRSGSFDLSTVKITSNNGAVT